MGSGTSSSPCSSFSWSTAAPTPPSALPTPSPLSASSAGGVHRPGRRGPLHHRLHSPCAPWSTGCSSATNARPTSCPPARPTKYGRPGHPALRAWRRFRPSHLRHQTSVREIHQRIFYRQTLDRMHETGLVSELLPDHLGQLGFEDPDRAAWNHRAPNREPGPPGPM